MKLRYAIGTTFVAGKCMPYAIQMELEKRARELRAAASRVHVSTAQNATFCPACRSGNVHIPAKGTVACFCRDCNHRYDEEWPRTTDEGSCL
jgi:NADH pyrophosphatase NudC (nudix superfamily)